MKTVLIHKITIKEDENHYEGISFDVSEAAAVVTDDLLPDRLIDCLFGLYYKSKRKYISPPTNLLVCESATSLAEKIRNKTVSCEQVVQAFINRIEEINGVVNAIVGCRFDAAIQEAKSIDANIKNGLITDKTFEAKPFLGIPYTTKESSSCKGMRNTFGLIARQNKIAEEDADIVKLMTNAGAILVGVSNMPQLNMWQETDNPIYGRTNNPYDSTRNAGGSCAGDCAAIAAGGVPIAVGTDIGGSVRIPAFMNGIFGHKTTSGLISTKGLTNRTGLEKVTMLTAGTLTKTANDIAPLLKILVDKNVDKLKLDEKVNVKNIQVFYTLETEDLKISPFTPEMKNKIVKVVKHFENNSNIPPQKLDIPEFKFGGDLWRYWIRQEDNVNYARDFTGCTGKVNVFIEFLKLLIGQSNYNIGALLTIFNEKLPIKKKQWIETTTEQLLQRLMSKLGENAVLIYPSAPFTASYHNASVLRPWNFNYFAIWNALKFPVTQVPLGLDSQGLPLGIQVVAPPYQDHLCIAVAKELENAFGGYVPPFDLQTK
ncbi:hypothetical protein RN001_013488 [Aquatica leii]|uniref:Amidase domain-containing protein n=1 Tax=Aquatica leii TaxID=1421715 RepID=A0AAN7QD94_9COLE|nr:hypothetical protein RN001_013488 [Aquatica leii]